MVHTAFEQGTIKFLYFKGESLPEGYKVKLPVRNALLLNP